MSMYCDCVLCFVSVECECEYNINNAVVEFQISSIYNISMPFYQLGGPVRA